MSTVISQKTDHHLNLYIGEYAGNVQAENAVTQLQEATDIKA